MKDLTVVDFLLCFIIMSALAYENTEVNGKVEEAALPFVTQMGRVFALTAGFCVQKRANIPCLIWR